MHSKKITTNMKRTPLICSMADLTSQTCRWPSGDPKHDDFHFCGRPIELGRPYCSEHCDIGYVASKPKPAR